MTSKRELRKAAVLISSLEEHAAQELLAKFPPAQAAAVREAARELDEISGEERRRVMNEFLRASDEEDHEGDDEGVELDVSLASKLVNGYEDAPPWSPPPENQPPFQFLHEARVDQLVRLLSGERPQMIALVMAHLPADKAASTLGRFEPAQQSEVLARLAELDDASPEVLQEIEEELQGLLAEKHQVAPKRTAGFSAVSAILGAAASRDRQSLLASLADRNANLLARLGYPTASDGLDHSHRAPAEATLPTASTAERSAQDTRRGGFEQSSAPTAAVEDALESNEEPSLPSLRFEDLAEMSDRSLATLVSQAEWSLLRLALSGAEESLIARITAGLSRREMKKLRQQLMTIGPVRLRDMEAAQQQLAALAERLCHSGVAFHPYVSTSLQAG